MFDKLLEKISEQFDEGYKCDVTINAYVNGLKPGEVESVSDKKQQLIYDIEIECRSWGIKGIDVTPRGMVEFDIEILNVDDEVVDKIPVKIDFDIIDYDIEWQKGSGYAPDTMDVRLTRDGKIKEVTLNFFYVDPSR